MNSTTPNGVSLNAGMRLPFPRKGQNNPFLGEKYGSAVIAVINALLNAKLKVKLVQPNQDGSVPISELKIANDNMIFDIAVPKSSSGVGGVAATIQACLVVTEHTTYLECQPILYTGDETYTSDGDPINVAKPEELRTSPFTGAVLSEVYETKVIYAAQPTGGTGVYLAGEDVGWIDLNIAARQWVGGSQISVTLTGVWQDYIVCEDADSNEYRIAKWPKNRNSLTSESIYGVTVDYAYPHNSSSADDLYGQYRVATIGGLDENQGYVPQYISGDVIYFTAVPTDVTTEADDTVDEGTPVIYQEMNPRIWARFFDQAFGT